MNERGPSARLIILLALLAGVTGAAPRAAIAENPPGSQPSGPLDASAFSLYRLVKLFDFDERPLGNYEETPMRWDRLSGPGLPGYARGVFDEQVGFSAAPSFRLDLAGGNVGYEYADPDLAVVPQSDYLVIGHVRAQGLRHARAFLAAYLVDRFGERIPGSERVSELIRVRPEAPQAWQTVQVLIQSDDLEAYSLRLQLWVLQAYTWREQDADEIDPIVRRDIYASAWFDDIAVYRLPRARLRFSNPGGTVRANQEAALLLNLNAAIPRSLSAALTIADGEGKVVFRKVYSSHDADPSSASSHTWRQDDSPPSGPPVQPAKDWDPGEIRVPLPSLPAGSYTATATLHSGEQEILQRRLRFAVLADLPDAGLPQTDFGVDSFRWLDAPSEGVHELLRELGCRAVKVPVPISTEPRDGSEADYLSHSSALLREWIEHRVDATGVIVSAPTAADPAAVVSTQRRVSQHADWRESLSPALAHLGGLLSTWQLGAEEIELRNGAWWEPANLELLREQLARFVTIPELVVPRSVLQGPPSSGDIQSIWVPADIPTLALPEQLGFLVEQEGARCWLTLEPDHDPSLGPRERLIDLARRIVLARVVAPDRIYLPAPFEPSSAGGLRAWQPAEQYVILRTLFHYLSGKSAAGVLNTPSDVTAIVFEGNGPSCALIWSWRDRPDLEPLSLYLGPQPRMIDLWGRPQPVQTLRGRTQVPLTPMPQVLVGVETPLALLQATFEVQPTHVQSHDAERGPVLRFRNRYDSNMSGTLTLRAPPDWQVEPQSEAFLLTPGQTLERPLSFKVPPRPVASQQTLGVHISLQAPSEAELDFDVPLVMGLHEVLVQGEAHWVGDTLVISQTLKNLSAAPVNFDAFCQVRNRPRVDRQFLGVAPGETAVQHYSFPMARELAGTVVHMRIQEIRGRRSLDQLVQVPN